MRENHVPITVEEYLALAYLGSDQEVTPDTLTGEQLAELPPIIRQKLGR